MTPWVRPGKMCSVASLSRISASTPPSELQGDVGEQSRNLPKFLGAPLWELWLGTPSMSDAVYVNRATRGRITIMRSSQHSAKGTLEQVLLV